MHSLRGRSTVAVVLASFLAVGAPSRAYTPESPEVKQMVAKGLEYLGSQDPETFSRLGALCLAGLAFVKAGQPEHPTVKAAIQACRDLTAKGPEQITTSVCDIYSSGLVIIFLSAVDGSAYRQEIGVMVRSLERRQLSGGGWTYESLAVGDTSMTQYGALGMWEAAASGYPLPVDRVARTLGWLMRTQDPSGGWGYHADDPGSFQLVPQTEVRLSLATAALGSIYLCADLLELSTGKVSVERDLPPALKPVETPGRSRARIDRAQLRQTLRNGTTWFNNQYRIDPDGYTHYYLYALERYQSLREVAERRPVAEPLWYNQGVEYLARTQAEDGTWRSNSGVDADTAFAILFLLRSMKKSIQKAKNFGDGTLTGGRGLPSNTADAELKQGRVVSRKLTGPATGLLEILNDPNHPDILYLADNLDQVNPNAKGGNLTSAQRAELDRVAESGTVEARLVALRALARARDLDNVPRLITALRDREWRVVQEANAGLARMARRLSGFDLPETPDEAAREKLIGRWKAWYRTVRPEAEFADDPP